MRISRLLPFRILTGGSRNRLAWFIWAAACGLTALALWLLALSYQVPVGPRWGPGAFMAPLAVMFASMGLLVTSRQPHNRIGWIYLIAGLLSGIQAFGEEYAVYSLLAGPGKLPAGEWLAWLQNWIWVPVVVQYMFFGPYTPAEAQEWVNGCVSRAQEQPRRCYELAVVPRDDNRVIGDITLELDQDQLRMASFAYVLHRQYWRRGYATEAMRALFNFGFDQLNLHRIYDACDVRNLASARVMEKLGLCREGHVRERLWKDGTIHDEFQYAILAREWKGQRAG